MYPAPKIVDKPDDNITQLPSAVSLISVSIDATDARRILTAVLTFGSAAQQHLQMTELEYQKVVKSAGYLDLVAEVQKDPSKILMSHAEMYASLMNIAYTADKARDRLQALDRIHSLIGAPELGASLGDKARPASLRAM